MEKLSGQLKFKATDFGPRLHKVTGQFFNWPKKGGLILPKHTSTFLLFLSSIISLKSVGTKEIIILYNFFAVLTISQRKWHYKV